MISPARESEREREREKEIPLVACIRKSHMDLPLGAEEVIATVFAFSPTTISGEREGEGEGE